MSYTNLLYHLVYATKERAPLITNALRLSPARAGSELIFTDCPQTPLRSVRGYILLPAPQACCSLFTIHEPLS